MPVLVYSHSVSSFSYNPAYILCHCFSSCIEATTAIAFKDKPPTLSRRADDK
ncbi:hypothetical protein IQ06DRAFT_52014 [Phaeosphaeriaceae sp. SRC1lsM3a]|nr:hypothetical protein IQ06DRAFT_52014 [Stagonospora sp. SRC1lsM3a]